MTAIFSVIPEGGFPNEAYIYGDGYDLRGMLGEARDALGRCRA